MWNILNWLLHNYYIEEESVFCIETILELSDASESSDFDDSPKQLGCHWVILRDVSELQILILGSE